MKKFKPRKSKLNIDNLTDEDIREHNRLFAKADALSWQDPYKRFGDVVAFYQSSDFLERRLKNESMLAY